MRDRDAYPEAGKIKRKSRRLVYINLKVIVLNIRAICTSANLDVAQQGCLEDDSEIGRQGNRRPADKLSFRIE